MTVQQRRRPALALRLAAPMVAIALVGITTADAFLVSEVFRNTRTTSLQPPSASTNNDDNSGIPSTFPLARRALLEKAEEMGTLSTSGGTYSTVGWSNRLGSLLTPAAVPGVYEAGRPFLWNSIDVGCRMVVIELSSGKDGKPDLFVHSPVSLDDRLAEAIDQIGTVKHVVSPNFEHVKFAYQWAERYPDANIWGCPGLMEREPNVRWTGEIPYGTRPPWWPEASSSSSITKPEAMWDWSEICPMHVDVEVNPFTGKPFFNEVVFYHPKSKTLLTTDTFWNYPGAGKPNVEFASLPGADQDFGEWELAPDVGDIPLGSRLWGKFGMDKLFRPFYLGLMVKSDSNNEFRRIASYISGLDENGWDVATVIPAHGDIIRGKTFCREVLKSHFKL